MAKFNLVRVITEYEMMKSVLDNEQVQKILSGEVPTGGLTPVRDLDTLRAMNNYVNELGQMKITSSSVKGKKYETFDAFIERLKENFIKKEEAKTSGKLYYSENPFDEGYVTLVSSVLSMENAEDKIRGALNFNSEMNEKIAELPIILGGKKQSSYIKLLAEYNEIYANISNLQNEIALLKEESKGKDAKIAELEKDLAHQIELANAFKTRVSTALVPTNALTNEEGMKEIAVLLAQALNNLTTQITDEVKVQGKATRRHVTDEADRVVNEVEENSYRKDYIETQIRSHSSMYPNSIKVLTNTQYISGDELTKMLEEVKRAAGSIALQEDHPAVNAYFNDLCKINDEHRPSKSTGKVIASVIGGTMAAALLVGAGYGIAQFTQVRSVNSQHLEIDTDYLSYIDNENKQKEDFENELREALENGTFYNEDGIPSFEEVSTEGVDLKNPEAKDYRYFEALAQEYAKDDDIETHHTSSTETIRALLNGAQKTTMANYYETNYANLLSVVSELNAEIDRLTNELNNANAKIDQLNAEIDRLQAEIDRLQALLDAAEQRNSELQAIIDGLQEKLDAAEQRIETLETENAELRVQVRDLTTEISELLEEVNRLKLENSVLLTDVADLNSQVYRAEKTIAQLQAQLAALESGDYTALMEQIADLQAQLAEAKAELAEVINENTSLKEQVVQLQQELSEAVENYNELLERYNELMNSEGGASQAELAALRAELAAAYQKIASYESKIVAIWNGLSGESTTNEDAMEDLEQLLNLYGIDYNDKGASSYSSSNEYEPGD